MPRKQKQSETMWIEHAIRRIPHAKHPSVNAIQIYFHLGDHRRCRQIKVVSGSKDIVEKRFNVRESLFRGKAKCVEMQSSRCARPVEAKIRGWRRILSTVRKLDATVRKEHKTQSDQKVGGDEISVLYFERPIV